jgi:colicin import membrane protein
MNLDRTYTKATFYALLVHLFLFFILIWQWPNTQSNQVIASQKNHQKPEPMPIEAKTVGAKEVEKAMQAITQRKMAEKQKRIKKQKQYEQKLANLKSQYQTQQSALSKLQSKKRQAYQKQQDAMRKLKKEKIKLAKTLSKQQSQLKSEKSRLSKLEQEIKAEREKLEAQKEQAEAARKKREKERAEAEAEKERQAQKQITDSEIAKYKNLIISAISQNWIVPPNVDKKLQTQFQITLSERGEVENVRLVKSSGNALLDRSARIAIYKASPLPIPKKSDLYQLFKVVNLTVKPEDVSSI